MNTYFAEHKNIHFGISGNYDLHIAIVIEAKNKDDAMKILKEKFNYGEWELTKKKQKIKKNTKMKTQKELFEYVLDRYLKLELNKGKGNCISVENTKEYWLDKFDQLK